MLRGPRRTNQGNAEVYLESPGYWCGKLVPFSRAPLKKTCIRQHRTSHSNHVTGQRICPNIFFHSLSIATVINLRYQLEHITVLTLQLGGLDIWCGSAEAKIKMSAELQSLNMHFFTHSRYWQKLLIVSYPDCFCLKSFPCAWKNFC